MCIKKKKKTGPVLSCSSCVHKVLALNQRFGKQNEYTERLRVKPCIYTAVFCDNVFSPPPYPRVYIIHRFV